MRKYFFIILLLSCLFLGKGAFASTDIFPQGDIIELPSRDTNNILSSLLSEITDKRISLFLFGQDPSREAVLVLLGKSIKVSSFNYLMAQVPKEMAIDFIKIGAKLVYSANILDFSTLLKLSVDELKKHAVEWLVRNELRIGGGNLSVSYLAYDGQKESIIFSYILVYNPKKNEINISIYSSNRIKPPKSDGGLTGYTAKGGSFWNEEKWLKEGNTVLSPFVINIGGKLKKNSFGFYLWERGPDIEINFFESLDSFEFKELSFLERQILSLNKTIIAVKNGLEIGANGVGSLIDSAKAGILNIIQFGGAAISSFFAAPQTSPQTTIVLDDKSKVLVDDSQQKEIQRLVNIISELELELEKSKNITIEKEVIAQKEPEQACFININTAPLEELVRLSGIGEVIAQRIIDYRNVSMFYSVDDLLFVNGIGEVVLGKIKDQGCAYVDIEQKEEDIFEEEKEEIKKDFCDAGIDINTANVDELVFLIGVGEVIAQRIIDYRNVSMFYSVDDLLFVNGIGPVTLEKIKDQGCAYVSISMPFSPSFSLPQAESQEESKKEEDLGCLLNSIEINTASKEELEKIVHIGSARADEIINLRQEKPFKDIDDLFRVSGISLGGARLSDIKEQGCAYIDSSLIPPEEKPQIKISGAETFWVNDLVVSSINSFNTSFSLEEIIINYSESTWKPNLIDFILSRLLYY